MGARWTMQKVSCCISGIRDHRVDGSRIQDVRHPNGVSTHWNSFGEVDAATLGDTR